MLRIALTSTVWIAVSLLPLSASALAPGDILVVQNQEGLGGEAQVDGNGCSQEQFCDSITAGVTGKGRDLYQAFLACLRADWQNDEPQSKRPGDCRFDRAFMGCVADGRRR
jgi:hypothetical protein